MWSNSLGGRVAFGASLRTLWSHFLPSSPVASSLICCVFWQTIRAQQFRRAPAFLRPAGPVPMRSNTGRKQRSLYSMKLRGTAKRWRGLRGVPVKGDGCIRDKGKRKRHAYKPMTCITHRCYRRRFVGGGGKKKAEACNSAAHVRKSEFPGMLF